MSLNDVRIYLPASVGGHIWLERQLSRVRAMYIMEGCKITKSEPTSRHPMDTCVMLTLMWVWATRKECTGEVSPYVELASE